MGPFVLKASWCADLSLANSKNGTGHANFMFGASVLEVPPKSMGIVVAQCQGVLNLGSQKPKIPTNIQALESKATCIR